MDRKEQSLEDIIKETTEKINKIRSGNDNEISETDEKSEINKTESVEADLSISSNKSETKNAIIENDTALMNEDSQKLAALMKASKGHHRHHRHHHHRKKWSKKKKTLVIMIFVLLFLILMMGTVATAFFHYVGKINVKESSRTEILDSISSETDASGPDSDESDIKKLEKSITDNWEANKSEVVFSDDVYNILVLGTDSRNKKTDNGRSDSMILISINEATQKVYLTSFMRDMYVKIPGVEQMDKLNAAYAYGGPDLAVETIEQNFKIDINKYVQVDFSAFIDTIDSVGGVTIDVQDEEVETLNSYLKDNNKLVGKDENSDLLTKGGTYNLNGRQALAYSRIRYVGNADFERTERQRKVMLQTLERAKDLSIVDINNMLDALLPELTTDITQSEIFSLVLDSPSYLGYEFISQRVPVDNSWEYITVRSMSCLGVDFEKNISELKNTIYSKTDVKTTVVSTKSATVVTKISESKPIKDNTMSSNTFLLLLGGGFLLGVVIITVIAVIVYKKSKKHHHHRKEEITK